jgi:hypothetical protein
MTPARHLVAVVALAALVGGCVVGPNYRPPVPPAGSNSPLVSVNPTAESTAQPPDD